ncbi:MAG TPA: amidohydrolase family protein, partial [Chitinophagaceae bacterium]
MRKQLLTLSASLFLLAAAPLRAQTFSNQVSQYFSVKADTVALTDATVIDGTGSPAKPHQTLIIINGRIARLGKTGAVAIPAGAKVINASGKTLIPGLVMVHEHLYYTMPFENFFNVAEMPYSFPRMYLAGGATTVRTAGSIEPQTDLNIKYMIEQGKMIGPDMDCTAPYIERRGYDIPSINVIKDSAEAARSVGFWADKGCTSFKMYMHITRGDLVAVVREAHARNMKVTGHLCTVTYREAAEIGIDDLEHGFMASSDFDSTKKADEFDYPVASRALRALDVNSPKMKDLIHFLIGKKVALTSTLPVFVPNTDREAVPGGGEEALLPEVRERVVNNWKQAQHKDSASAALFKKELVWEKQFYDAGGLLISGTDPTGAGRTVAGYANHTEMELLAEAGFTPEQVVKICTLNGAVYLGRTKEIGTLETGKKADIVLIDGDLSKDIKAIRNTEIVFKN